MEKKNITLQKEGFLNSGVTTLHYGKIKEYELLEQNSKTQEAKKSSSEGEENGT